jgi:hypothetical protein
MPRETRQVYSGKGNLINVARLYSLATWGRYGERLQFYSALEKNSMRIRELYQMGAFTQEKQEELKTRLAQQEIFEEYYRLDKKTNKFGVWKNV